jgi:hypothetical protein
MAGLDPAIHVFGSQNSGKSDRLRTCQTKAPDRKASKTGFVIGRTSFAKISAVKAFD